MKASSAPQPKQNAVVARSQGSLPRSSSGTNVAVDFFDCGTGKSAKSTRHGWTGDDECLAMPNSWKRSAFVVEPSLEHPCRTEGATTDIGALRLAFLEDVDLSLRCYSWVKNDETPWGTVGPSTSIIECSDRGAPDMFVAERGLERSKGVVLTYVPFDVVVNAFVAHMRDVKDVQKSLSYDAFASMLRALRTPAVP